MAIYALGDKVPVIPASCYIAPEATIIGAVVLGERCTIMAGAVLRADNEPIVIGDDTNIQENCVLHTDPGMPLAIGKAVTVGHMVTLHGCTVGDGSLIGINATILNKAVIGKESLVGAGAVVTEGKTFPDRALVVGAPARAIREVSDENAARLRLSAEAYVRRGAMFKDQLKKIG